MNKSKNNPSFLVDLTTQTSFRNSLESSGACQQTECTPEGPFDYAA